MSALKIGRVLAIAFLLSAFAGLALAETFIAWDPSRSTPNARVLGLGRAFVGLADDSAAIYTNPAGLAERTAWEVSSLSGHFLDEYNYFSMAGYSPLPLGVFGIGFAGSAISGAYVSKVKEGSDPNDPIYELDYSTPPVSNSNNLYVLSYGAKVGDWLKLAKYQNGFLDSFNFGLNLKLFSVGMTGDGITDGSASGRELDLALQYRAPWPWLRAGFTLQNALPFSMGGKLSYANGHEETYPAVAETGLALKLLGQKDALRSAPQELSFVYDVDYHPSLGSYPLINHCGFEWKPLSLIALRLGLDQDANGDGAGGLATVSNMTAGAGVYYGGFRFDYAFMENKAAPGVANHYFSLSFAPQVKEQPAVKKYLVIDQPADKLLTFAGDVDLKGRIGEPEVKRVFVDRSELMTGGKPAFAKNLALAPGKNKLMVEGFSQQGRLTSPLATEYIRVLRLRVFKDVAAEYWEAKPISLLAMANIISGYPDGAFKPEGNITRAEMCSLLVKAKSETINPKSEINSKFQDVNSKHWAVRYIDRAAELEIVKGYPGNVFKPNGNITRAEGLAMIARFAEISEEAYTNQFGDLPITHWVAKLASAAYAEGILDYLKGRRFEPNKLLTRAETVEMLQKTARVQFILKKDLLNWDSY